MQRRDLIGSTSAAGTAEGINGVLYTIWKPEEIIRSTAEAVCDMLKARAAGYMKCDGVTQTYEFDSERFTRDVMKEVESALGLGEKQ